MNKLIFLTGLLTALLFIGTAHGEPYEETSELEQQILQAMRQDSDALMETIDEEDNEMASVEQSANVVTIVRKVGCATGKRFCHFEPNSPRFPLSIVARRETQDVIRTIANVIGSGGKIDFTMDDLCKAIKMRC